jgi:PAS domain S-box-containing protein
MSENASLRELVDLKELQAIQDSFAKTVGTSSVIFSPEGELLTQFSNPTGFCSLIQSTEEGKRRCFLSFMEMCQKALELEEPVIYYCFVLGGHFVAPIIIDGAHKGTMFAGQFILQTFSAEQLKALEKIAVEINVDPTLLVEEAKKMRVVEEDRVWKYSSLLFQIVAVITRLGAQADELNRAKDALQKAHKGRKIRVQERTAELARANEELKQEIIERKKAEDALRESEEKVRSITASAHDAIIMVDAEETISFWNEAAERIFGYTAEEMIGTKLHGTIIPERFCEAAVTGFKSFRETGQGAAVGKTLELAANRKDGTELPVELSLSAVKIKGKWNAIGLIRDISERKEAEGAIKESEERFRTIFDRAVDGIFLVDLDTRRFHMANNAICHMLGYTVEELTNMGPADIIPKEDLPRIMKEIERVIGEEILEGTSIPMQRKDGSVIHTNINGALIEFGGKKYLLGIIRDITELKKKTEALKRFNKLAVGRELRMIELKKEINGLLEDLDKEPRYKIAGE